MTAEAEPKFRRIRRSASQANLESRHQGREGRMLENALRTPPQGREGYSLTHGLHPYPARFHPNLPRTILKWLAQEHRDHPPRLCDPFMGGGTLLVESLCRGWEVTGNDINPIAALVARERCRSRLPKHAVMVWNALEFLQNEVERRRRDKIRVEHPHLSMLKTHYQPHIFAEMLQWSDCLEQLYPGPDRDTLRFVFSSLVGKFSRRIEEGNDGEKKEKGNFPRGAFSLWMQRKTREVLERQQDLSRRLPDPKMRPQIWQQDVRELSLPQGCDPFDCLITSPPYPGTYDYLDHHRLRLRWLHFSIQELALKEIGTRRQHSAAQWKEVFRTCMLKMRQVTVSGGHCFLVLGDWVDQGRKTDALEYVEKYADSVGWSVEGAASVRRPVYEEQLKEDFGESGRWEHLIWLRNQVQARPPSPIPTEEEEE